MKDISKDENRWAIFNAVLRLDVQKGHLAWKISDVARASKVSRTLIYYYFGNSKETLLKNAVEFVGEEYLGLSESRRVLWKQGKILESLLESRRLTQNAPYVHFFYMLRRHMDSPVGQMLRDFEVRYRQKLQAHFPAATKEDIAALSAVLFGLVTTPDLQEDGIRSALTLIRENMEFQS